MVKTNDFGPLTHTNTHTLLPHAAPTEQNSDWNFMMKNVTKIPHPLGKYGKFIRQPWKIWGNCFPKGSDRNKPKKSESFLTLSPKN